MANHKSSEKRARQTIVRNMRNKMKKSRVRTMIKKVNAAIEAKNKDEASKLLVTVQSLLGKLSKTSAMRKQTAARKTSRLAQKINKL